MIRRLLPSLLLFASACVMAENAAHTVSVTGTGESAVAPDRATVQMSIQSRGKELDAVQAEAAKVTAAVLSLTDKLDIKRSAVDTTGATVRPDYRWNRETEQQELQGYIAERQIGVEVDDLDKLGRLVEGAVAAGVNQVSPPQLESSKQKAVHREALQRAAKDARANAEVLAETLGAKLGDPVSISDGSASLQPPVPLQRNVAAMASDSAATYNAGAITISATVMVVFELVN